MKNSMTGFIRVLNKWEKYSKTRKINFNIFICQAFELIKNYKLYDRATLQSKHSTSNIVLICFTKKHTMSKFQKASFPPPV